ncbi:MAG: hypothetical protein KAQ83_01730 [Nanoarchaeota archaeon]|nr:hypothetical protein [Nanoarchaeota archaeon]
MKFKTCFIIAVMIVLVIQPINAIDYSQNFTIDEAEEFMLNVDAFDPDEYDILNYYFSPPLDSNGSWTPNYDDAGIYFIEVKVSDGDEQDTINITLFVEDTDRAPIIIATGKQEVYEGEEIQIKIDAFDPDGDEFYFEGVDMPENSYILNKTIYWTPEYTTVEKSWIIKVLNFYHIDLFTDTKEVSVKIKALANELNSNGAIPVEVINVNLPPILDEMDDIIIEETGNLYLNPSAQDADGDYLRYFYSGWVNKNKYQTDYDDAGNHSITIIASDGLASSSIDVNIFVENKNRFPIMYDIEEVDVYENQTLKIKLDGEDADKDNLLFDINYFSEAPEDSEFVNETFIWKPDFDTVKSSEIEKEFKINFSVWDGENYDVKESIINVLHTNRAPSIYDYSPEYDSYELYVEQYMVFSINVSDLDEDNITYKWNFGLIDRKIDSPIIKRVFRRPGAKKITAIASDGIKEVKKSWLIRVKPPIVIPKEKPTQETSEPGEYYHFVIQHPDVVVQEPAKPWYHEFWIY